MCTASKNPTLFLSARKKPILKLLLLHTSSPHFTFLPAT
ncbi:hypothetical protein M6B38_393955 [Iris pallida]|uniref:Uncharacterized protein n=1 Tax=Iris pallida TaxID=29817 RepID=A0AAX6FXC2_IRIPA|nr:hypothetical protein M6B38_393955 [Iris pallida]